MVESPVVLSQCRCEIRPDNLRKDYSAKLAKGIFQRCEFRTRQSGSTHSQTDERVRPVLPTNTFSATATGDSVVSGIDSLNCRSGVQGAATLIRVCENQHRFTGMLLWVSRSVRVLPSELTLYRSVLSGLFCAKTKASSGFITYWHHAQATRNCDTRYLPLFR